MVCLYRALRLFIPDKFQAATTTKTAFWTAWKSSLNLLEVMIPSPRSPRWPCRKRNLTSVLSWLQRLVIRYLLEMKLRIVCKPGRKDVGTLKFYFKLKIIWFSKQKEGQRTEYFPPNHVIKTPYTCTLHQIWHLVRLGSCLSWGNKWIVKNEPVL